MQSLISVTCFLVPMCIITLIDPERLSENAIRVVGAFGCFCGVSILMSAFPMLLGHDVKVTYSVLDPHETTKKE